MIYRVFSLGKTHIRDDSFCFVKCVIDVTVAQWGPPQEHSWFKWCKIV